MWNLAEIQRPVVLAEAVRLLRRPNIKTAILAGGTSLIPQNRHDVQSLVDLHNLNLAFIKREGNALRLGAMTTLQDLAMSPDCPAALSQAARESAPPNVRNVATLGGTLASGLDRSPLPVVLLVLDAALVVYAPEARQSPLATFLAYRPKLLSDGALIAEAGLPLLAANVAYESVARTPADAPIVCAAARVRLEKTGDGPVARDVRLAAGGAGLGPARLERAEAALEGKPVDEAAIDRAAELAAGAVTLTDTFLATADYSREMVRVLVRRAVRAAAA